MATLLHRIGRWCASHRWTTIAAWAVALLLVGGAAGLFSRPLSNDFSIPGSRFEVVRDQLKSSIPEAAGINATVVLSASTPFTPEQRALIAETVKSWEAMPEVVMANDPFALQEQIDGSAQALADGRQRLTEGADGLTAAQDKLTAGAAQLVAGKAQLASSEAELTAGEATLAQKRRELENGAATLAAKRRDLDAGAATLAQKQRTADAGAATLAAKEKELAAGAARLAATEKKLADTTATLDATGAQLDASQAELDVRRAAVEAAIATGTLTGAAADAALADLAVGQGRIDQGRAQVAAGRQQVALGLAALPVEKAKLAAGQQQLVAGKAELAAGARQLAAAAARLADGRAQFTAGEQRLADGRAQLAAGERRLADGRAQLEAGKARSAQAERDLAAGRAQLESGRLDLASGQQAWAAGNRIAALTEGMRLVNEPGTVAMTQVRFDSPSPNLDTSVTARFQEIGEGLESRGITVDYSKEITQDLSSVMGPGEVIGLAVAALVLLLMLGSLGAAGLPLLMALVGVGIGLAATLAATHLVEMNSTTPALALMLGLAVGIDYSLFILNRHRSQLAEGMPVRESIALAAGTSGNAVTFAGMTVIIALAALTLTGMPFLGVMGLSAAATVAVAVLVAVTLMPAVLSLAGLRVLPRKARERVLAGEHLQADEVTGGAHRDERSTGWAAKVVRRPWLAIAGVLGVVALLAIPVGSLRLGLPDGSAEPPESTAYATYDLVRDNFGAGANGPIVAVAELAQAVPAGDETALKSAQADLAEPLAEIAGVERVVPFGVSADRRTLAFQIVPSAGPSTEQTVELVRELDARTPSIGTATASTIGITGQTVANIDISGQLADALPRYLAVVIGLSFILLLLVFRSVLVPLLATAGFLLSLGAAFGAVVAVYQLGHLSGIFQVHEPTAILSFIPILLIGVLFGLAMDYQVFIVSAMRESHVHGENARLAVVTGFNHSARVVTAAAIIMISVFGGFVFSHLAMIRPIGLGLAMGVLIDAFLVRMTLTPAVLHLLGERAWWLPRWLNRLLPDVDVEGAQLERRLGVTHPGASQSAEPTEPKDPVYA